MREAIGTYILPVDADDLISTTYIENAVAILEARPEVKVVYAKAEFFGLRQGEWKLPTYSLHKLAMHNQIYVSAMYRKADALAFGGYCETILGREDWEFLDFHVEARRRSGTTKRGGTLPYSETIEA